MQPDTEQTENGNDAPKGPSFFIEVNKTIFVVAPVERYGPDDERAEQVREAFEDAYQRGPLRAAVAKEEPTKSMDPGDGPGSMTDQHR